MQTTRNVAQATVRTTRQVAGAARSGVRCGVQAVRQQANVVRQNLAAAQRNFQANVRNFQACVQGGPQFAVAGGGSLGTQGAKFEKNVQQFVQSNPAKYKPRGAGAGKAPKPEKKCLFEGNDKPLHHKNKKLAGSKHPKTEVEFNKEGFPKFENHGSVKLKGDYKGKSSGSQMKQATKQLKEKINSGKVSGNHFTKEQFDAINKGKGKIPGYTWHHNEEEGIMELVDENIHQQTGHLGGYSIWGK